MGLGDRCCNRESQPGSFAMAGLPFEALGTADERRALENAGPSSLIRIETSALESEPPPRQTRWHTASFAMDLKTFSRVIPNTLSTAPYPSPVPQ